MDNPIHHLYFLCAPFKNAPRRRRSLKQHEWRRRQRGKKKDLESKQTVSVSSVNFSFLFILLAHINDKPLESFTKWKRRSRVCLKDGNLALRCTDWCTRAHTSAHVHTSRQCCLWPRAIVPLEGRLTLIQFALTHRHKIDTISWVTTAQNQYEESKYKIALTY